MKTRFAPSPTGWMHLGNARTALFNYLYAHKSGHGFLLRIEDTDADRSAQEYVDGLLADLEWLGSGWDEGPYWQSQRGEVYAGYYERLVQGGHAYPCFCSEEHLALMRKLQLSSGQPPRYDGTCAHLTAEQVAAKVAAGGHPTLRFRVLPEAVVEFVDLVKGPQRFIGQDIGDFIIRRHDGSSSFMFCNAIDDAVMGVTHALRGEDHLTNTPRQIMILRALNLHIPHYGHFALINGSDGAPLSKRNGSLAIRDLRAQGYLPVAVANYIARLGHYYASNELLSLPSLAEQFSLSNISTSPARHDITHLRHWQKEALLKLQLAELRELLWPYIVDRIAPEHVDEFIELCRGNILFAAEISGWVEVVTGAELAYGVEELAILRAAGREFVVAGLQAVRANPGLAFKELADVVKQATGAKGKELFMPLRIILTGCMHGPELARIMLLLSHDLLVRRFMAAEAIF